MDLDISSVAPAGEGASPEALFQSSAVGIMHRIWFPKVSWPKMKDLYYRETGENHAVSWAWYKERTNIYLDLSFVRDDRQWKLSLKELLKAPVNKWKLFQYFKEQPSEGLVFPLIGECGIFHEVSESTPDNCVVKNYRDRSFCIELLSSFAKNVQNPEIYLEETEK